MGIKKNSIYLFGCIAFVSCNNNPQTNDTAPKDSTELVGQREMEDSIPADQIDSGLEGLDTIADILFNELAVSIEGLAVYDVEGILNDVQTDSVYLYAELGYTLEGCLVSIKSDNLEHLKVEQAYETSASISEDGPHCDLYDWEHYRSKWVALNQNAAGHFACITYTAEEQSKFPSVDMEQMKQAAEKTCGSSWAELLEGVKTPNDPPSWVGIGRYFLRISGTDKHTKKRVIKLITIESPLGC